MSLITEDGTGLINSESYVSVTDCATYFSNRGITNWATITTAQQEQALRRATDYMTQAYRSKWKGRRVLITQALDWPRVGVVLDDFGGSQGQNNFGSYGLFQVLYTIVPIPVVNACCELAFRAAAGELAPDLDRETVSETVGSIKTEYRPGAVEHIRYRSIDLMLKPYLVGSGAQLVRA